MLFIDDKQFDINSTRLSILGEPMFYHYGVIDKAAIMVNEVRDFRLLSYQDKIHNEELDLRITQYIENFRLIGETAAFFRGTAGIEYLINAIHNAGGDFETAQGMLDGILD